MFALVVGESVINWATLSSFNSRGVRGLFDFRIFNILRPCIFISVYDFKITSLLRQVKQLIKINIFCKVQSGYYHLKLQNNKIKFIYFIPLSCSSLSCAILFVVCLLMLLHTNLSKSFYILFFSKLYFSFLWWNFFNASFHAIQGIKI